MHALVSVLWCSLCFQRIRFKNIFDFTTAGDWDCVAAVERLPALHYRFYFLVLWDHGFHCGTLNLLEGHHTQGAEVTGQLRVNGKARHLQRCTLEDQSLALKRKHMVHKYVNTATIFVSVLNLFILT